MYVHMYLPYDQAILQPFFPLLIPGGGEGCVIFETIRSASLLWRIRISRLHSASAGGNPTANRNELLLDDS